LGYRTLLETCILHVIRFSLLLLSFRLMLWKDK
jgi:hypothetical protein